MGRFETADSTAALAGARVEVSRCRRALDGGSPPRFWFRRLTEAAKRLEAAAAILRMQAESIRFAHPEVEASPQKKPKEGP